MVLLQIGERTRLRPSDELGPQEMALFAENRRDNAFFNPWGITPRPGVRDWLRWKRQRNPFAAEKKKPYEARVNPDPLAGWDSMPSSCRLMWLGHASVLFELDGLTVLTDPVFGSVGRLASRLAPFPLPLDDMPRPDVVLLSHGHLDHLDAPSLTALCTGSTRSLRAPRSQGSPRSSRPPRPQRSRGLRFRRSLRTRPSHGTPETPDAPVPPGALDEHGKADAFANLGVLDEYGKAEVSGNPGAPNATASSGFEYSPSVANPGSAAGPEPPCRRQAAPNAPSSPLFVVPRGLSASLPRCCDRVLELDWWEQVALGPLRVTLAPAQHWHQRTPLDTNKRLWGSFVIEGSRRLFFCSDSGYFKGFSVIGRVFDGFDLAMLPLGSFEPRWLMAPQHLNPNESVQAMDDLGARHFLAIHWGTFDLADEPIGHGVHLLDEIIAQRDLDPERFHVLDHGGSLGFDRDRVVAETPRDP